MKRGEVKTAVMTQPGCIAVKSFPYPDVSEDTAIVRMEMSGICGTDKHNYRGETIHPSMKVPFPIIPGHENVGVIAEVGERAVANMEVSGLTLKLGDRVVPCCDVLCGKCYWCRNIYGYPWCENIRSYGTLMSCRDPPHLYGGWSQYMYLIPEVYVAKVPDNVPPELAVLTEPMAVVYGALCKAQQPHPMAKEGFGPGDTVLIQGAGPLGLLQAIMVRIAGAETIIMLDYSDYRLNLAEKMGVDHTINMDEVKDLEVRVEKVLRLTEGRGADLVVEAAGSARALPEGLSMLRRGGTYLELGNFVDTGVAQINPHKHICAKNAMIIGVTGMPYQGYATVLKLLEKHPLAHKLKDLVTHRFPIEQAEEALKKAMTLNCMKVVITP